MGISDYKIEDFICDINCLLCVKLNNSIIRKVNMAYQVTMTNAKSDPTSPTLSDWLATTEASDLLSEHYPELDGTTPSDIVSSIVADKIENPALGFISVENTETTYTTVWESEEAYQAAILSVNSHDTTPATGTITLALDSTTVVGVGTTFLTETEVGGYIHVVISGEDNTAGKVQSIESDISLTLENNSTVAGEGVEFHVEPKISALAFLQQQYKLLYPMTTTIEAVEI